MWDPALVNTITVHPWLVNSLLGGDFTRGYMQPQPLVAIDNTAVL